MSEEKEDNEGLNKSAAKDPEEIEEKEDKRNEDEDENAGKKKTESDVAVAVVYNEEQEKEEKRKKEKDKDKEKDKERDRHRDKKKSRRKAHADRQKEKSEKKSHIDKGDEHEREKRKRKKARNHKEGSKITKAKTGNKEMKRSSNQELPKDKSGKSPKTKKRKEKKAASAKFLRKLLATRTSLERFLNRPPEDKNAHTGSSTSISTSLPKTRKKLKEGDDSIIASGPSLAQVENYDISDFGIGQSPEFPKHLTPVKIDNKYNGKLFVDGVPFWRYTAGEVKPVVGHKDLFSEKIQKWAQNGEELELEDLPPLPELPKFDETLPLDQLMNRDETYFSPESIVNFTTWMMLGGRSISEDTSLKKEKEKEKEKEIRENEQPKLNYNHPTDRVAYTRFNFKKETQPFKKAPNGAPLRRLRKVSDCSLPANAAKGTGPPSSVTGRTATRKKVSSTQTSLPSAVKKVHGENQSRLL